MMKKAMIRVGQPAGVSLCPYCKSALQSGERILRCLLCGTTHHFLCWSENGNRCSVFHCSGVKVLTSGKFSTGRIRLMQFLISIYCLVNFSLHLFLPRLQSLVDSIRLPHAIVLVALEMGIVITGCSILKCFLRRVRWDEPSAAAPLTVFMVVSNFIFFLLLLLYGITEGPRSLFALIEF